MITATDFSGKTFAIYGLARSGLSTAAALLSAGAKVSAWDAKEDARARAPAGTSITDLDEVDLREFDALVVTPGLPLNRHPVVARAREAGLDIIGDIELFARARPELPPHRVVGITGTNGKSTTTALVHHILKSADVATMMAGNIGLPILGQQPLPAGGIYVLELSSFQIDLTRGLDCDVAVLLNITPDHLDRYSSFSAYAASKTRLLDMQSDLHAQVISRDSERSLKEFEKRSSARRNPVIGISGRDVGDQAHWPALQGPHNAENAAAARAVCKLLGLSDEQIEQGLRSYPGLPHRMEVVRNKDGILFVDDSKATNPTAAAPALAAFKQIRWILGGQAKADNLDQCMPYFDHVRSAYVIGESATLFDALLSPHITVKNCGKLEAAVREAAADAAVGDTVLLSPACASFDQFRDFEDRGNQFRAFVGAL